MWYEDKMVDAVCSAWMARGPWWIGPGYSTQFAVICYFGIIVVNVCQAWNELLNPSSVLQTLVFWKLSGAWVITLMWECFQRSSTDQRLTDSVQHLFCKLEQSVLLHVSSWSLSLNDFGFAAVHLLWTILDIRRGGGFDFLVLMVCCLLKAPCSPLLAGAMA